MTETNNQGQNNRGQSNRRPAFVQNRKSVPYTISVESNAMLEYMNRHGGAAAGAFQRIAGLIQLTSNNAEVRERLDVWLDEVIKAAQVRTAALKTQQEKYSEGMVVNVPRPKVPDNYKHTVEITHPVFWKLIGLVEMIDSVMSEIEYLWLAGHLEDVHLGNANGQAVNTIKTLVNRMYYVTNASRNRKGGLYSPDAYKELMRALLKDEEPEVVEPQPEVEPEQSEPNAETKAA